MAQVKMKALRSFEGTEGMIRRGDIFLVEDSDRADELERLELAERTDSNAEVTNISQKNAELDDMTKDELKSVADAEGVDYTESMTKEEIKQAILRNREEEYLKQQAQQTQVYSQEEGNGE